MQIWKRKHDVPRPLTDNFIAAVGKSYCSWRDLSSTSKLYFSRKKIIIPRKYRKKVQINIKIAWANFILKNEKWGRNFW